MPLVKKRITVSAGSTSDQILQGTTYEYVDGGTRMRVAAADATGTYSGDVVMNYTVNNSEFASDCTVSALVDGEPFGWTGNYLMNDMVTTGAVRNRPVITFTNNDSNPATVDVAVFISSV